MKVEELSRRWETILPLLRCPRCGSGFEAAAGGLRCGRGHCYDFSAKGYINLAPGRDQKREKYGAELFEARSRVFADGFYRPVAEAIETLAEKLAGNGPFVLADAGCGEGYYSGKLKKRFPQAQTLGLDLSRDGVRRAARNRDVYWMVADLKRLPLQNGSVDLLMDVLTPADYGAFGAALKPEGRLIKVVPGADYLREIRERFQSRLRNPAYDNGRVLDYLRAHGEVEEQIETRRRYPLTPEQSDAFLRMTPMTFSIPEEERRACRLEEITVHMEILCVRLNGQGRGELPRPEA